MIFIINRIIPQLIKSIICIFLLFLMSLISLAQNEKSQFYNSSNNYSDSLFLENQKKYDLAVTKKDTAEQIQSLIRIAYFYGTQAKYKASYDNLWLALLLAENSKNLAGISSINQKLGRHYGYYGRKEEGLSYFEKAIAAHKEIIKRDSSRKNILAETYHSMCSFYRDFNDIEMQRQCVDSCKKYLDPLRNLDMPALIGMEEAVILTNQNQFLKAEKLFDYHFNWVNNEIQDYLVLYEYYQGVNYYHLNKIKQAEEKLDHALKVAATFNAHLDFVPKIYKMLSQIYFERGESSKGVEMLNKLAAVNFDFFDSRSDRNKSLLEIQDEQRLYKKKQLEEMQMNRLEELEYARNVLFFQRAMLIGGILLLSLLAFYYVKYLTKKYKLEKEITKKKQQIEFEKVQEVIELKNKELATSALKLIEKDEIVGEFGLSLKSKNWKAEPKELKSFIRNWDLNINRNWEEFQSRFTAINSSFYTKLHQNYPHLTSSDDKLCALIKLKLSSKEISRLLGLSNESVHTKRSRLRTKLGLERSDNLTDFMEQF